MNKYEKALYNLPRIDNDYDIFKELVERATKIKPFDYQNQGVSECKCGHRLYDNMNYCPNCGQALDLSDQDALISCAECGIAIEEDYYMIGDNYLQVEYFDKEDGKDNTFCSIECLCKSLLVIHVDLSDQDT